MLQPLGLDGAFATVARVGIPGVELLGEPAAYDEPLVHRLLERYDLRVTSLTAAARLPTGRDLSHPDSARRERTIAHLVACMDFARRVGAPVVAVAPAAVGRHWLESTRDAEWRLCVDGLHRLAEQADRRGVVVALEVLNRYAAPTVTDVETALRLIREADAGPVGIVLDLFHASIEERSIPDAIRAAGRHLVNVQVADNTREGPGHGSLDFDAIRSALTEIGYGGALALESFPRRSGAFPDVGQADVAATVAYVEEFAAAFGAHDVGRRLGATGPTS